MELTVFSVGRGLATLIELPPSSGMRVFGVVDCFEGSSGAHPVLRRLRELAARESGAIRLAFVAITHYHADHFLGVGRILEEFEDRVGLYADSGLDPREIMASEFPFECARDRRARADLKAVERFKKKYPSRVLSITSPRTELYTDGENGVRVVSVAPPGNMLHEVGAKLSKFVGRIRRDVRMGRIPPIDAPRGYDLNRTSSAIEVSCGEERWVIGGDVLRSGWELIPSDVFQVSGVFVLSHHGSKSGFPGDSCRRNLVREGSVCVASGRGRSQPSWDVVEALWKDGCRVFVTNCSNPGFDPGGEAAFVLGWHYGLESGDESESSHVRITVSDGMVVEGFELRQRLVGDVRARGADSEARPEMDI